MLGRGSTLHCLLMVRLDLESLGQLLVMVQTRVCNNLRQTLIFIGSDPRHDFSWIPPGSLLSHSMLSWNIVKAAKDENCF